VAAPRWITGVELKKVRGQPPVVNRVLGISTLSSAVLVNNVHLGEILEFVFEKLRPVQ
jgi:hypothetical protein